MLTRLGDINLADPRAVMSLAMRAQAKFAKHAKAFGKPSVQHLGNELDEWRVGFKLSYQFCEPAQVLDELYQLKASGNAVPMMFNYLEYKGWVILTDIDIDFSHVMDNGRPLEIKGSLSLLEYVGERKPLASLRPKPAVKKAGEAVPVQTYSQLQGTTGKQPFEHLADALIAQHRAQRLLRNIQDVSNADAIDVAVSVLQSVIDSLNQAGATNPPTTVILNAIDEAQQGNGATASTVLAQANTYFAEKTATVATRFLGGI